jgi:hypothetical protein
MANQSKNARDRLHDALGTKEVRNAALEFRETSGRSSLSAILKLGSVLAKACGEELEAASLRAEVDGYTDASVLVPEDRKATAYASAFPVKALDLGLLDPEEIFLGNREKFSEVSLMIGQPVEELAAALSQIRQGGVLALKVPASEIVLESAFVDPETEVHVYILPREIQRIVESVQSRALNAVIGRLVEAALDLSQND